jgi:hypothetical protein
MSFNFNQSGSLEDDEDRRKKAELDAYEHELKELTNDPRYWRERDPHYVDYVTKAFQGAYAGAVATDAAGRRIDQAPRMVPLEPFDAPKERRPVAASSTDDAELEKPLPQGLAAESGRDAPGIASDGNSDRATYGKSRPADIDARNGLTDLAWRGSKPPMRTGLYDPQTDKPTVQRVDYLHQLDLNRQPWADPSNPSQAGLAPPRKPTHREAERESESALDDYESNLGRANAKYPIIDLPDHGRQYRMNAPLLHNESKNQERSRSIIDQTPGRIVVKESAKADGREPWHAVHSAGKAAIDLFDHLIREESARFRLDPSLVRAIMYVENAQGYYGKPLEGIGAKSILPMNIRYDTWAKLGFKESDFYNARMNIRAGILLIQGIQERLHHPTVSKLATLYNSLSKDTVTDYGARVAEVYQTRPWEE